MDKDPWRRWLDANGVADLDPTSLKDCAKVHAMEVPTALIKATTAAHLYVFWRIVGKRLERFLGEDMGVRLNRPTPQVVVLVGSDSDLPYVVPVLARAKGLGTPILNVLSCHRNPGAVYRYVADGCEGADVIVAVGGKAFHLPGVLDALIAERGDYIPVVGVGLGSPGTESFRAARFSIEQLPEQRVILDEDNNRAYMGQAGLEAALKRIAEEELTPLPSFEPKSPRWSVPVTFQE